MVDKIVKDETWEIEEGEISDEKTSAKNKRSRSYKM